MSGEEAFKGIMRFVHNKGKAPCMETAFYGRRHILEEGRPLAFAHGALAERLPAHDLRVPCAGCGARVSVDEVTPEYASFPQVYIAPERRGRPRGRHLKSIAETKAPIGLGQIAKAIGISRNKLREMCEAGVVPNAFRTMGKNKGHWRVPVKSARAFIAKLTGGGNASSEADEFKTPQQMVQ